jgi:2-polyprenyl-6-methoxyphenol hydroxylase-like FAD-dependent oxidoreductase
MAGKNNGRLSPDYDVIVAGGGPTGLMLAGELALAGIDVAIFERRKDQFVAGSRAGGLHARTIEVLDQRGIADRFLSEGEKVSTTSFAGVSLDLSRLPTRHPYILGLRQKHIERFLADWVARLNVPIHYGTEIAGFVQDKSGIDVVLRDGRSIRAQYLVGCDGGRSAVRKLAGIEFPGSDPTTSNLIAEGDLATEPSEWGIHRDAIGVHAISRVDYEIRNGQILYADSGPVGVMVTERTVGDRTEPTLEDLREALSAVFGTDFGIHNVTWISRFTDAARQAAAYRKERVLVAGDAAHIHPPDGGQGLQTGVQDAVNLGWKLGQVVKGTSSPDFLDTYHNERHPVAADVLSRTLALVALRKDDARANALRSIIADLLVLEEARDRLAATSSGLNVRYDLGDGHPLLGHRMPDLDLMSASGSFRAFSLLTEARPLLLSLNGNPRPDVSEWADRLRLIEAHCDGDRELPDFGRVSSPTAILVRPDGYIAWVGEGSETGLAEALHRWCGPPSSPA